MLVVFDSLTGQTKRFANNLGFSTVNVKLYEETDEDVFLVTRSINFGQIPEPTKNFLDMFKHKVIGVAVSGNTNWGANFGMAGVKIENNYNIPLVKKFEGSGFKSDVEFVKNWIIEKTKKEVL